VKNKFSAWMVVFLLIIGFLIPLKSASADIGPKPTFRFLYDFSVLSSPPEIKDVILYQCIDLECNEREVLPEVPGQYFECDGEGCYVSLLTGRKAWQIEVRLAEKILTSQSFTKQGFYSRYNLVFMENEIKVVFVSSSEPSLGITTQETTASGKVIQGTDMIQAGILTVLVEIPLAALLLLIFRVKFKNIIWVILGNLVSIPVVWLLVPLIPLDAFLVMIFVLLTSSMLEMAFLGALGGEKMTWVKAAVISVVINIASFTAGLFLLRY